MSSTGKSTEFPLPNMPRMGRRNAVAYPSRILDDDGAFSPMNLLNNDSSPDIDPEGVIAQELNFERRNQVLRDKKLNGAVSTGPATSVLDGWKKLHEASKRNKYSKGIERLFEPNQLFKSSMSTTETKPKKNVVGKFLERDEGTNGVGVMQVLDHPHPVIPWRKQDVKHTTIAEERRKLFESFNKTSMEPPETPHVSELTLQNMAKKNKRKKNIKELKSELAAALQNNKLKEDSKAAAYSNIQPKVNTRWKMLVEQNPKLKNEQVSESTEKENKVKRSTGGGEKLTSTRAKGMNGKPLVSSSLKKDNSNTDNQQKLVTNYPASETVKNTSDQLPLTIAPRFNHKKALGLTYDNDKLPVKNRTEDSDVNVATGPGHGRLFEILPTQQKPKYEKYPMIKPPIGNSVKSTFLNLQRVNNGGIVNAGPLVRKRANSSTAHLVVGQLSANILGTPTIGMLDKRAPPITTIQPPPLPYLASVQSQMNEFSAKLPPKGSVTLKSNKVKKDAKPGKLQAQKINNSKIKGKATPEPAKDIQQPAASKVVPTLGAIPNRYNNIYIGPYSGSDSEGELKGLKQKR